MKSRPFFAVLFILCISCVAAFGAGNIPSYAYLKHKAFRHGDIEDTLADLVIREAAGIFSKSTKFSSLMVKQIYFGNWNAVLVDTGTLGRGIKVGSLRILAWALAFATFGYATGEFEVTNERLGCYRPEEHIDNPKGYADGEDARALDERLRGPVDPLEYAVDPRTGMKNYIANEDGDWATSAGYVRWSVERCIEYGRRYQISRNEADLCEAFRLLGQSLHTLEDFSAHSNYCELALIELGYSNVFPHVGSNTKLEVQGKMVYPLVTGIFGGTDFICSLLGEANDHLLQNSIDPISQTGMIDLGEKFKAARAGDNTEFLKNLLSKIPGQSVNDLKEKMNQIAKSSNQARESGNILALGPEELGRNIYPILEFRDNVTRIIENTIDQIPGFNNLVQELQNSLASFVLTELEPFISPIIGEVTSVLNQGTSMVMSDETQYEVWNDPSSSTPTHSMLSKDHFTTYLNEPAGKVAIVIVKHTVELITKAWSNSDLDTRMICNDILSAFHHPALRGTDKVQNDMFEVVRYWIEEQDSNTRKTILEGLTAEGVKTGQNHTPPKADHATKASFNYEQNKSDYQRVVNTDMTSSEQFVYQNPEFERKQNYSGESYSQCKYSEGLPPSFQELSQKQDICRSTSNVERKSSQFLNEFGLDITSVKESLFENFAQSLSVCNDKDDQFDRSYQNISEPRENHD